MSIGSEPIFQWLSQYAYEPQMVYMLVFAVMIASGFGFPVPEEVTIVSVGILSYMGSQPHLFPPPEPNSPVINGYEAALVTTFSVIFADYLIFYIGRFAGRKLIKRKPFAALFTEEAMNKVNYFTNKHGLLATFIFRFTPGLRFPAHILLGTSSMSFWKFGLVDGLAAMISVPTQILLIYHFGEPILVAMQKFKIIFLLAIVIFTAVFFTRKWLQWRAMKNKSN